MVAEVYFPNEDLHWFCGKRTFIDSGVYMRLNAGEDSRFAPSVLLWFCILDFILVPVCCWLG